MQTQTIDLDMITGGVPQVLHVSQYDTGARSLIFNIFSSDGSLNLSGVTSARVSGLKPDKHAFEYDADYNDGVVTVDCSEQMTVVAGIVKCAITLYDANGKVQSAEFDLAVKPNPVNDEAIISDTDLPLIIEAMERSEAAADEAANNVILAKSWAVGGTGTRSGEDINNAEYWARYAEHYAVDAIHWRGNVTFADIPTSGMVLGDMYNVTDEFTTDNRFNEGSGKKYPGGTNIIWNSNNNKWDVSVGQYKANQIIYDNSNNSLSSGNVQGAIDELHDGVISSYDLLKDTVGWTGKNRLKNFNARSLTNNGITWTLNADGSITANGVSTDASYYEISNGVNYIDRLDLSEKYILSGNPQVWSDEWFFSLFIRIRRTSHPDAYFFDNGNGVEFDLSHIDDISEIYFYLRVGFSQHGAQTANSYTFKPMLRRADILDDTYEPYHESVETVYEEEIHGINLLKVNVTSKTIDGVTFTVNADKSVVVNGTATANTVFPLNLAIKSKLEENGRYILSGCPSGGATNKYKLDFRTVTASSSTDAIYNDIGEGVEFTLTSAQYSSYELGVSIRIENGQTVSNLVFKPMLRKADIEDSTYRPYNPQAIQNQLNAQGVLGAKNLLPYPYLNGSRTINTVTFTVNSDGSVTVNGTATGGDANFILAQTDFGPIRMIANNQPNGDGYKISDGGVGTGTSGSGFRLIYDSSNHYTFIGVTAGTTVSNKTVYPMIRLASDPDDTYQPYAMTNRELTEKVSNTTYYEDPTSHVRFIKYGRVASIIFENTSPYTFTADVDAKIMDIPDEFLPQVSLSFRDTLTQKRLVISNTVSRKGLYAVEALSNDALRGGFTYITK